MNLIEIEKISNVVEITHSISHTFIESDISIVNINKDFSIAFEDSDIPNFISNISALNAGLKKFDLWRSPDNKINIVKDQESFTGFNLNLSRALSYFRRMF